MKRQSGFLDKPSEFLYPCVWDEDNSLRLEAWDAFRTRFFDVVEPEIPQIRQVVRFTIIGSGASYNWAEDGDIDIQVWVSDPDLLADVRKLITDNLLGITCADLGLETFDCQGVMEVQYYAKQGNGTAEENLAGVPYACYDMDMQTWLVEPFPMTPQIYGDLFMLVEPRADEMAQEADDLLADYERDRRDFEYWSALDEISSGYEERVIRARIKMQTSWEAGKAFFHQMMLMRGEAYKPGGKGVFDDRDAIWKLLEVWGITTRMKELAHGKPGVQV